MEPSANARVRRLIRYFEKQRDALQAANADDGLLRDISSLLIHVRGLGPADLDYIFRDVAKPSQAAARPVRLDAMALDALRKLSADDVELRISNKDATKSDLELVAAYRFGMPSGSLPKMSRAALLEKLRTLISNERGHETIRRLLKQDGEPGTG